VTGKVGEFLLQKTCRNPGYRITGKMVQNMVFCLLFVMHVSWFVANDLSYQKTI